MPILQGRMATPEPSRYLARLCFHFSRKIRVDYDAQQGVAEFAAGRCRMQAEPQALHFVCDAADAERLAQVRQVIDAHVALFSRKAPLHVDWEGEAADAPAPAGPG